MGQGACAEMKYREVLEEVEDHKWLMQYKPGYRFTRAYKERQRKIDRYYRYDLAKYLTRRLETRKTLHYVPSSIVKTVKSSGTCTHITLPRAWRGRSLYN